MVEITRVVNWSILIAFVACFAYQGIYLLAPYIKKAKKHSKQEYHKFAILIAARNEEAVIGKLIESIQRQNYPVECMDIYVVADNCTDETAKIAYSYGAYLYERENKNQVGKGYALQYLMEQMKADHKWEEYDGFFVFDADNLLEKNYIEEMNRTFCDGYQVITSYRNSKNFDSNWISAGYGLWFLHESQLLNQGRMLMGNSCMVSGTGYLVAKEVIERNGGWKYFLLTEDIEFNADQIANNVKIGYCKDAVFYDEQPVRFKDSWNQRLRWVKGYFQVFHKFGTTLGKKLVQTKDFSCYDMLMCNLPALVLTLVATVSGIVLTLMGLATGQSIDYVIYSLVMLVVKSYLTMYALGMYTTITEWKQIQTSTAKKIAYTFSFPVFMMTFIPISFAAMVRKVEWKPIAHTYVKSAAQLNMQ